MSKVRPSGCAVVLFGALVFLASAALADTCTPVVYAFRHAEDTNPPNGPPYFALTPTGQAHAKLYVSMVKDLTAKGFCDVTKVYAATTETKIGDCKDSCASATNAFDTATPLARDRMSGADPIISVGNSTNPKESRLYEYLGNGDQPPASPNYDLPVATELRNELLETANLGQSSAIFWTSQGLHVLGGVIIKGTSKVPDKNAKPTKHTPPRNAAYIFTAIGSAPNIKEFNDIPLRPATDPPVNPPDSEVKRASFYLQCFNHLEKTYDPKLMPPSEAHFVDTTPQIYYCGYSSQADLGGSIPEHCTADKDRQITGPCDGSIPAAQNAKIQGKICDTTNLLPNTKATDVFGACN